MVFGYHIDWWSIIYNQQSYMIAGEWNVDIQSTIVYWRHYWCSSFGLIPSFHSLICWLTIEVCWDDLNYLLFGFKSDQCVNQLLFVQAWFHWHWDRMFYPGHTAILWDVHLIKNHEFCFMKFPGSWSMLYNLVKIVEKSPCLWWLIFWSPSRRGPLRLLKPIRSSTANQNTRQVSI